MNWNIRRETVIAANFVLVFAIAVFSSPVVFQTYARVPTAGTEAEGATALAMVNRIRAREGKPLLNWSDKLTQAAQKKAEDIVKNDYFEHTSPDGRTPWSFVLGEGYDYRYAGENLAIDFSDISQAVKAWEDSPAHYSNIVSDKYADFGFAVAEGKVDGSQTKVFVQFFGRGFTIYERAFSS